MRDRTATINRLKSLTIDLLKRHGRHRLRQIEVQIASLDAAIAALVAENPHLSRRRDVLAGLAPITRPSGTWRGRSVIQGGRAALRQARYMPAIVAMRFNPYLRRVYDRLTTIGKHAKVAIAAVMRKLIVPANARVRDYRLWTPKAA
ncbi:transposase [Gluconacetobacter diazotrophicus]|uniref:transposase n=1 Tax=Gluconacetobacter diazotrophicus TaxID=33996 RepID=UPI000173D721|nr:transposase [Gluconacetobacter diazotrophicus]TWB08388.1 transposase IS116/IS110/IS902 family protein [Gluconacetobacter diazotrophicus]